MNYSLSTPLLDAQIAEIRLKIRLSMNGIVSEQMSQKGIVYKKNYGVSISRIKEIATSYQPNHDLAQRLWLLQIRETMILATLLEPLDKFTSQNAREWISQFNQIELVEQANMNLFCKLPFAYTLACEWIQSENIWTQTTGFILAARIADKLNIKEMKVVIQKAVDTSATTEYHLYKAVGLCLCRLCRINKDIATFILKEIESISLTNSIGQQYISTEVKQEILFLNNL